MFLVTINDVTNAVVNAKVTLKRRKTTYRFWNTWNLRRITFSYRYSQLI